MRSPRSLVPLVGWLAATLTSIVLASVAMLPVLRTATSDDGALTTADRLRTSGDAEPIPLPSVPSMPVPSVTSPPPADPPSPEEPDETPDETEAEPSGTTTPARPTTRPTTRPPTKAAAPPTVEDGWTVTTDGNGVKTYLRSFRTAGGTAVIRISNGAVQLVTATPTDGFEVATVQNSPDNLAVYFNEPNHSFIVHAVWNVDRPVAQVTEVG